MIMQVKMLDSQSHSMCGFYRPEALEYSIVLSSESTENKNILFDKFLIRSFNCVIIPTENPKIFIAKFPSTFHVQLFEIILAPIEPSITIYLN